jgi:hypothetical protein
MLSERCSSSEIFYERKMRFLRQENARLVKVSLPMNSVLCASAKQTDFYFLNTNQMLTAIAEQKRRERRCGQKFVDEKQRDM